MGSLFSRQKPTTTELLETLEKRINEVEEQQRDTYLRQKHCVGNLVLASVCAYLLLAAFAYFYWYPESQTELFLRILPFLAFPIFVYLLKVAVTWLFTCRMENNGQKLSNMKKERQKILDHVMETETYKTAKEILERFDPATKLQMLPDNRETHRRTDRGNNVRQRHTPKHVQEARLPPHATPITPSRYTPAPVPFTPRQVPATIFKPLQQHSGAVGLASGQTSAIRVAAPQPLPPQASQHGDQSACRDVPPDPSTPISKSQSMQDGMTSSSAMSSHTTVPAVSLPSGSHTRPILPSDRSTMDKIVDYFLGDGPSNRFALICNSCYAHNGMALAEEFEYIAYRCCYCFAFNPAKKQRPRAPGIPSIGSASTSVAGTPRYGMDHGDTPRRMSGASDVSRELLLRDEEAVANNPQNVSTVHLRTLDAKRRTATLSANDTTDRRLSSDSSNGSNMAGPLLSVDGNHLDDVTPRASNADAVTPRAATENESEVREGDIANASLSDGVIGNADGDIKDMDSDQDRVSVSSKSTDVDELSDEEECRRGK